MKRTMIPDAPLDAESSTDDRAPTRLGRRVTVAIVTIALLVVGGLAVMWATGDDNGRSETAHVAGQGGDEPRWAADGARLTRRVDGLVAELEVPTPRPGAYEYPAPDNLPPWADPHPRVTPGSSDAPEVFTAWMFVFNDPASCTDGICDLDDLGPGAEARGGSYQLDGLIADGDIMEFSGRIRLGQDPLSGQPLDSPETAEVHVAIAPHGRLLSGPDGWRQLNGPLGDPTLWWAASFAP